jgi:hypothetical protein
VRLQGGHRILSHGGEVSGFTAQNVVYPDDGLAVVVLTNLDATDASGRRAGKIATLLLAPAEEHGPIQQVTGILKGLQHGTIDRALLTDNNSFYFSADALKDFAASLGPLGESDVSYAGRADAARRDDVPRVPSRVREGHRSCLDLHDAGREARAVPGRPGVRRVRKLRHGDVEEFCHGDAEGLFGIATESRRSFAAETRRALWIATELQGTRERCFDRRGAFGGQRMNFWIATEARSRGGSETSPGISRALRISVGLDRLPVSAATCLCGFARACAATRSAAFLAASGSPR